jgi:tetratricopeptide (TPR) repeat protein
MVVIGSVFAAPKQKTQKQDRVKAIMGAIHTRIESQSDVWFDKGEFPRVVQLLRVQHGLDPNDYDIATNLGWMLENVEEWNEALAVYVRFRKLNPGDPDASYPEANFYFQKKAYAKVPPLLEPSIDKQPHPNSYRILAHAFERMKMYGDSKRIWQKYLKRFPNDGAAKVNLKRVEGKVVNAQK